MNGTIYAIEFHTEKTVYPSRYSWGWDRQIFAAYLSFEDKFVLPSQHILNKYV